MTQSFPLVASDAKEATSKLKGRMGARFFEVLGDIQLQKILPLFGREDSGKFVKHRNYEQRNPVFAQPPAPAPKRTNL